MYIRKHTISWRYLHFYLVGGCLLLVALLFLCDLVDKYTIWSQMNRLHHLMSRHQVPEFITKALVADGFKGSEFKVSPNQSNWRFEKYLQGILPVTHHFVVNINLVSNQLEKHDISCSRYEF
jgi:hypothetical protein